MHSGIHHFTTHPDAFSLLDYRDKPTENHLTVCLNFLAWGDSGNLFCYFADCYSGEKYALSVFWNKGFKPYNGGSCFKDPSLLGCIFEITVSISRNGKIKFDDSILLEKFNKNSFVSKNFLDNYDTF